MKFTALVSLFLFSSLPVLGQAPGACPAGPGKHILPLQPVQDQDGLGTCYANAASLLLRQALGSKVPISYNALAILHGVNEAVESGNEKRGIVEAEDLFGRRVVGSGGDVCKTVDLAKSGGICAASATPFEAQSSPDTWNRQNETLVAFGSLIDKLNSRQTPPSEEDWERYTRLFAARIADRQESCEGAPEKIFGKKINLLLPRVLLENVENERNTVQIFEERIQKGTGDKDTPALKEKALARVRNEEQIRDIFMVMSQSASSPDVRVWRLKPEYEAAIERSAPNYLKLIKASEGRNRIPTSGDFEGLRLTVSTPLEALVAEARSRGVKLPSLFVKDAPHDLDSREAVLEAYRAASDCARPLDATIVKSINLEDACESPGSEESPVLRDALVTAKKIVAALKASRGTIDTRATELVRILAPECLPQMEASARLLKNVQCESTGLEPGPKELSRARSWVEERLCQNQLVSVGICTDFMVVQGPVNTNFCTTSSRLNGEIEHGAHAVTIVGRENTTGGGVRYLVQNSWGQSCPFADPKMAAGKNVNCELENGKPTGRFWIDSASLLRNSYDLQTVSNGKP